jgi:hypothetical protein
LPLSVRGAPPPCCIGGDCSGSTSIFAWLPRLMVEKPDPRTGAAGNVPGADGTGGAGGNSSWGRCR